MKDVLDLIDKRIQENRILYETNTIESSRINIMGRISELKLLKKEILNEAVVCDGETYQTDCKTINALYADEEDFGKYCLKCNRQFDKFGKEITS